MIDLKNIKYVPIKHVAKDPVRFPKVINVFEEKSKKDFKESIKLEIQHVIKEALR